MSGGQMSAAEERVWARMPEGTRRALAGLSGTELRTLLLGVARDRAAGVTPAEVMRRWRDDRFVRPAVVDPRRLGVVEARIWQLLPPEVDGVELAPVVPLGTCSAVGPVSQNRVVTTMRGTEVLSDATNALAIEAAGRRRRQPAGGSVHLAACQRHLRAQDFGEGRPAHFRLFALVSSARDAGSGTTQGRLLALHLGFWRKVLAALLPEANPRVHIVEVPGRERGEGYYTGAALRITADDGAGGEVDVGDGGFTTWTGRLMNDAKERCLVSCLATERVSALAAERVTTQDDPAGRQGG